MKSLTEWEIVTRQVTIYGFVTDDNDFPVQDAVVELTSMPSNFEWQTVWQVLLCHLNFLLMSLT